MAGGDWGFGDQEEGKGLPHGSEHHPVQRAGQPGATGGRALLARVFRLPSKVKVWPRGCPHGDENFKEETNPKCY